MSEPVRTETTKVAIHQRDLLAEAVSNLLQAMRITNCHLPAGPELLNAAREAADFVRRGDLS